MKKAFITTIISAAITATLFGCSSYKDSESYKRAQARRQYCAREYAKPEFDVLRGKLDLDLEDEWPSKVARFADDDLATPEEQVAIKKAINLFLECHPYNEELGLMKPYAAQSFYQRTLDEAELMKALYYKKIGWSKFTSLRHQVVNKQVSELLGRDQREHNARLQEANRRDLERLRANQARREAEMRNSANTFPMPRTTTTDCQPMPWGGVQCTTW